MRIAEHRWFYKPPLAALFWGRPIDEEDAVGFTASSGCA
jgi:hypothetical protein